MHRFVVNAAMNWFQKKKKKIENIKIKRSHTERKTYSHTWISLLWPHMYYRRQRRRVCTCVIRFWFGLFFFFFFVHFICYSIAVLLSIEYTNHPDNMRNTIKHKVFSTVSPIVYSIINSNSKIHMRAHIDAVHYATTRSIHICILRGFIYLNVNTCMANGFAISLAFWQNRIHHRRNTIQKLNDNAMYEVNSYSDAI